MRLRQRKAETGATIAYFIGKHFLHQPARQRRKAFPRPHIRPARRLQQGRPALDIGNDIPQRGKALLLTGGLHDPKLPEQSRNI